MAGLWKKIVGIWEYLIRDELDIQHKITNITLLIVILIETPAIGMSIVVHSDILGLITEVLVLIVTILSIYYSNKYPKARWPFIFLGVSCNLVLFPLMFFGSGGRSSGMLMWMVLASTYVWILVEGWMCYVLYACAVFTFIGCIYLENTHPELVKFLPSAFDESIDQIIGFILITFVFGMIFKYQTHVYNRNRQDILERDEELRQSNITLERASQAKSDFLANMSHEIRTPINAVLGLDEMILRECKDKEILQYAADIDSAGHQLLSLINDILDFSKIESGKMEIHPVEYELFSVLNDCYNMIITRAKQKNLNFTISNDPKLPAFLFGDEVRVRQIIMNLLTNAIKYTTDGEVKLNLSREEVSDDEVNLVIKVKDTGMGISPENIDKLFGSFIRVDEKKNRNIEGTGLGLAITKSFIDLMGGTIRVESKVHVGSTFTAVIPQKIASSEPMGEFDKKYGVKSDASEKIKSKTGTFTAPTARILVVDDVKMNLNVVRLLLKNSKIEIDLASGGRESLAYCKMKHYDVILMDHMMPEMDGIEAFHEIREMEGTLNADTPVVALTANAIVGADEMYLKEGFTAYLSKPLKGETLEAMLINLLPDEKVVMAE